MPDDASPSPATAAGGAPTASNSQSAPGRRTLKHRIQRHMLSDSLTSTGGHSLAGGAVAGSLGGLNSTELNERLLASMNSRDLQNLQSLRASTASFDFLSPQTTPRHSLLSLDVTPRQSLASSMGKEDPASVLAAASALASLGVASPNSSLHAPGAQGMGGGLLRTLAAPQRRGVRRGMSREVVAPGGPGERLGEEPLPGQQLRSPAGFTVPASAPLPVKTDPVGIDAILPPPSLDDTNMGTVHRGGQRSGRLRAAQSLGLPSASDHSLGAGGLDVEEMQRQLRGEMARLNASQGLTLPQPQQPTGASLPNSRPPHEAAKNRPFASLLGSDIPLTFPQKLMELLSNPQVADIVTWLPHGKGFLILQKRKFALEVMPLYFKHSKFTSFTRKLNRWGFQRVARGPEMGAYYHKFFQRGNYLLCMQMHCQSTNKSASSTAKEGNEDGKAANKAPEAKGTAGMETEPAVPTNSLVDASTVSSPPGLAVAAAFSEDSSGGPPLARTREYNRLSKLGMGRAPRASDRANASFGGGEFLSGFRPAPQQRPLKSAMKGSTSVQPRPLQQPTLPQPSGRTLDEAIQADRMSVDPILGVNTASSRNHALIIANALDALKACNDQALLAALVIQEHGKAAPKTSSAAEEANDLEGPSTYQVQGRVHAAMQAQLRQLEEYTAENYNRIHGTQAETPMETAAVAEVLPPAAPANTALAEAEAQRHAHGAVHDNILRAAMLQRTKKLKGYAPALSQGGVARLYHQINGGGQQSGDGANAPASPPRERRHRAVRRASAA
ncbi:hypothetical protein ACHAXT_002584 [Thalassiosira profunda]